MGRSSTAAKPQKRDADAKLAQSRLSVLELAKELGNVAEACRQRGLDRTSFYEWKRRVQTQGFDGLMAAPPENRLIIDGPRPNGRRDAPALRRPGQGGSW